MTDDVPPSPTEPPAARLWPTVLGGWVLAALVLCLAFAGAIASLRFPDPDDAMRLLEVRDWLGGQSWWDVGQHRLNGGDFAMHWSRLVDLPIAAAMLVLDPFLAPAAANRIAMTVVPLLTLLALMALAADLTRRVSDVERAKLALLLAPLSIPLVYQMRPLRIDHHGWQVVLAMAATTLLVGRATARNGMLAGLALATLVTISLEGLPVAVAITTVAALAWAWEPSRRAFLVGLATSLFAAAVLLHVVTRGPGMFAAVCDAVSPAWLAMLGVAAVGLSIATQFGARSLAIRLGALAVAGLACATTLLLVAPDCLRGPFATLDPLVYRIWYQNVPEGLPIWRQDAGWAAMTMGFPIVGVIGTGLAWRRAGGTAKMRWAILLAILVFASALSLLVMRTGATANALALPGGAWALLAMLERTRRIGPVLVRTLATAGALLAASPGLVAGALFAATPGSTAHPSVTRSNAPPCQGVADVRALAQLPASTLFAPIDVTPEIVAMTHHHAIAGGYHRNTHALHRVIAGFTDTPEAARAAIIASSATYLVACPGAVEMDIYRDAAPGGLWARLDRGERFAWLVPVSIPGSSVLAWRINNSSRAPLSGAPVRP
ncbi:hypothetical protein ASF00_16505 [Sphingomonas sp. Leaf34]|uniref:hypothetical protein n=1 Tax=Sphingomonas sp. Leaf34 TaxID=1736216 RepID=UPI0006F6A723|nr:hypothetical protein [Sphingomonas sp. Leaf34]KQN24434.1 hypothetical protein ASF00_16505 [Sphingomonas sp. Leaf34]